MSSEGSLFKRLSGKEAAEQKAMLEEARAQIAHLEAAVAMSEATVSETITRAVTLEQQLIRQVAESRQALSDVNESTQRQIQAMKAEHKEVELERTRLKTQVHDLEQRLDARIKIEAAKQRELSSSRKMFAELKGEVDELTERAVSFEAELASEREASRKARELKEALEAELKAQTLLLEEAAQSGQKSASELERRVKEAEDHAAETLTRYQSLEKHRAELETRNAELEKHDALLEADNKVLVAAFDRIGDDMWRAITDAVGDSALLAVRRSLQLPAVERAKDLGDAVVALQKALATVEPKLSVAIEEEDARGVVLSVSSSRPFSPGLSAWTGAFASRYLSLAVDQSLAVGSSKVDDLLKNETARLQVQLVRPTLFAMKSSAVGGSS